MAFNSINIEKTRHCQLYSMYRERKFIIWGCLMIRQVKIRTSTVQCIMGHKRIATLLVVNLVVKAMFSTCESPPTLEGTKRDDSQNQIMRKEYPGKSEGWQVWKFVLRAAETELTVLIARMRLIFPPTRNRLFLVAISDQLVALYISVEQWQPQCRAMTTSM